MALKTCPHCGHNVSDKATKCPQCGKDPRFTDFQLEQQEQQRKKKRKKISSFPHWYWWLLWPRSALSLSLDILSKHARQRLTMKNAIV